MSKRFKMVSTALAALFVGSLFGGCGWLDGNALILLEILNEELAG